MAIKSTKKVLASVLSLAMISQPFCGAKNFIENKNIPQKSSVIKKEKPTGFDKIKEFAKKHPVKAAVGGVVGLGLAINYLVSGHRKVIGVTREEIAEEINNRIKLMINNYYKDDEANALTMEDVDAYVKGNRDKFVIYEDGTLEILDKNITKIGPFAFFRTNITKIKIPNSVTTIGIYAFDGCTSLKNVTIPNSVATIGIYAFSRCTSLNSVIIPNSVEKIGEGAFAGCTSLNSVTIPNSVTKIGEGAFQSCKNLGEVKFEESSQLIEIGKGAFFGCGLTKVTIPSNCTYFDNSFPCVVTKYNEIN